MPTKVTWSPNRSITGLKAADISATHDGHHEAQKFTTVGVPENLCQRYGLAAESGVDGGQRTGGSNGSVVESGGALFGDIDGRAGAGGGNETERDQGQGQAQGSASRLVSGREDCYRYSSRYIRCVLVVLNGVGEDFVHETVAFLSVPRSGSRVRSCNDRPSRLHPVPATTAPPQENFSPGPKRYTSRRNSRRTVRDFSPDPVPREVIEYAIRTASTAPSGAHRQPWTFVLVGDAEKKRAIREAAEAEERQNYEGGRLPVHWREALEAVGYHF